MTLQKFHVSNLKVDWKFKQAIIIFHDLAGEEVNYSGQTVKKSYNPAVIWQI